MKSFGWLAIGVLVVALVWFFILRELPAEQRLENVRRATIEIQTVRFGEDLDGDSRDNDSRMPVLQRGDLESLTVAGTYSGAAASDFSLIARTNQFFEVSIDHEDQTIWRTSPNDILIDPDQTSNFKFEIKFMLSQQVEPGTYRFLCTYDRNEIYSTKINVE